MAVNVLNFITEDEYLDLEAHSETKHEYLAGQIFAMAGGTPEHALCIANAIREFGIAAKGGPCRVFSSDLRIRVEATRLNTYPDASIICGEPRRTERKPHGCVNPVVLVEVLSETTQDYDRGEKWRHYQMIETLMDYMVVWQDRPRVERYSRLPDGGWRYDLVEGPDESVSIKALGAEIPMVEIYRGVDFPPVPILREVQDGDS